MPYYTFSIGWPHKDLSPNGRPKSHFAKARQVKTMLAEAFYEAKAHGVEQTDAAHIHFTFHPKAKGPPPDSDNALASVKAAVDGIAKALGLDDRYIGISHHVSAERRGCVVVNVSTGDAAKIPLKGTVS